MKKLFSLFAALLFVGSMWAVDPTVLFHETFGNNTGNARNWNNSYSVKSGVATVYANVTGYTITNAKQSKNTNGVTGTNDSGLQNTTVSSTQQIASFEVGPLSVASYSTLAVSYQWKAGSTGKTYYAKLYYKTSSDGEYTEVSGTGNGATSYVTRSFSLPAAAQVSTLYLKAEWYTSNTTAFIDEFELTGIPASDATIGVNPKALDFGTVEQNAVVAAKTFALTGLNLTDANDVTVTAPSGYKVSIGDADPATSLTITPSSGSIASTTIKVTPVTSSTGTFNSDITISSDDLDEDSTVTLTMTVVTPVPVTGVTLDKTTLPLYDEDTYTLTATIAPNDATNKNVTWESDDTGVATVDENGLVTAKTTGTANITCKSAADPTISATCIVTVVGPDVTLDFTSNDGWGFPTDAKASAEATFTKGDYSIKLGGGYQYYTDDTELLVGKTNAYLILPTFTDDAIVRVVTLAANNGSKDVTFNIFEGDDDVSTEVTSCKLNQVFDISPKKANKEYKIKITNNYNARFTGIKIYLGEPDPIYTVKWSLGAGADESLGELEKMGASDSYTKYFDKDILTIGTYTVKVFKDDATEPITTTNLAINEEVGKYHIEFDYDASLNKLEASATRTGTTTAVDNTEISNKAVKFIQNGQLFIELNGHIYNVQGQVVK